MKHTKDSSQRNIHIEIGLLVTESVNKSSGLLRTITNTRATHDPVVTLVLDNLTGGTGSSDGLRIGHGEVEAIASDNVVKVVRNRTGIDDRISPAAVCQMCAAPHWDVEQLLTSHEARDLHTGCGRMRRPWAAPPSKRRRWS